jgi:hypothetical protein
VIETEPDTFVRRSAVGVVVAAASVLCLTMAVAEAPTLARRFGWTSSPVSPYPVGSQVDVPPPLYSTGKTILVFSRSGCSACELSRPTLSHIIDDFGRRSDVHIVLATPSAFAEDEVGFARDLHLDVTQHVAIDFSRLRLTHVPTLLVVNDDGVVVFCREGVLTEDDRGRLQQLLTIPGRVTS